MPESVLGRPQFCPFPRPPTSWVLHAGSLEVIGCKPPSPGHHLQMGSAEEPPQG